MKKSNIQLILIILGFLGLIYLCRDFLYSVFVAHPVTSGLASILIPACYIIIPGKKDLTGKRFFRIIIYSFIFFLVAVTSSHIHDVRLSKLSYAEYSVKYSSPHLIAMLILVVTMVCVGCYLWVYMEEKNIQKKSSIKVGFFLVGLAFFSLGVIKIVDPPNQFIFYISLPVGVAGLYLMVRPVLKHQLQL